MFALSLNPAPPSGILDKNFSPKKSNKYNDQQLDVWCNKHGQTNSVTEILKELNRLSLEHRQIQNSTTQIYSFLELFIPGILPPPPSI